MRSGFLNHSGRLGWAASLAFLAMASLASADEAQIARGRYLVTLGGCIDCHSPGYFLNAFDEKTMLSGSEVGFQMPGLGVFYGPNLTPDPETGLGNWTEAEIVRAIQTGERPDGRILAPIMPWQSLANLTAEDALAIASFLKSMSPIKNKVPGPFGVGEQPTSLVMKIVPPAEGAAPPAPSQ